MIGLSHSMLQLAKYLTGDDFSITKPVREPNSFRGPQTKRFLTRQDRANGLFHQETKNEWQKMKPLYKPFRGTMRKELRQKMKALAILNHPTFGENSQNDDTKFYESGHFRGDLSSICFQSVSRRFARNLYESGKTKFYSTNNKIVLCFEHMLVVIGLFP